MDDSTFWTCIEDASAASDGDSTAYADELAERLQRLTAEELSCFEGILNRNLERAYTWELWGAAYLINGGCSDDGFLYFRGWLVMQGRTVFEEAVQAPDSLAAITGGQDELECEDILYTARELFERKTGTVMPVQSFGGTPPGEPRGARWKETDLAKLLPRLAAVYE